MTPKTSHARIQAIGERFGGIQRYLEIGVAKGTTFFEVHAEEKHAVDPRFRFDPSIRASFPQETYHSVTSDEFFQQSMKNCEPFDFIFLDGLHTYSQTLRDFLSSQVVAHTQTVWLIDDTVPTDAISADPDLKRVQAARKAQGQETDQTWMGDTFKVVAFIDGFLPKFTCLTLEEHGQTLVLPIPRRDKKGHFRSTEEIENLNFLDVILLRENLLRPTKFDHILEQVDEVAMKKR